MSGQPAVGGIRHMRIPTAMAAGYAVLGTAVAQLLPALLVDRHLARAERLIAGNDFSADQAEMDAFIALEAMRDLGLPVGFEVAFAASRTRVAVDSLTATRRSGESYRSALDLVDRKRTLELELHVQFALRDATTCSGHVHALNGSGIGSDGGSQGGSQHI